MNNLPQQNGNYFENLNGIDILKSIVQISSSTKEPDGIQRVQNLIGYLLKGLGFFTEFLPAIGGDEKSLKLLVATYIGSTQKTITLVGHADTVAPFTLESKLLNLEDKLIAPGIADNKGGLIVGLLAVGEYLSQIVNPVSIRFVISPSEEIGSPGFHHHFTRLAQESFSVFGLEPALNNGSLISSRNGNRWYLLSVKGRNGHCGRLGRASHNAGNEIIRLANLIINLESTAAPDLSLNIGSIQSDHETFNSVCGHVFLKLDVRYSNQDTINKFHTSFENIISELRFDVKKRNKEVSIFYSIEDDCPAMEKSFQDFGDYSHSGGAADINYFGPYAPCCDGFGPIGGNFHRKDEFIIEQSLHSQAEKLCQFMIRSMNEYGFSHLTHTHLWKEQINVGGDNHGDESF